MLLRILQGQLDPALCHFSLQQLHLDCCLSMARLSSDKQSANVVGASIVYVHRSPSSAGCGPCICFTHQSDASRLLSATRPFLLLLRTGLHYASDLYESFRPLLLYFTTVITLGLDRRRLLACCPVAARSAHCQSLVCFLLGEEPSAQTKLKALTLVWLPRSSS